MPCTTILAGKNATYDGSTMIARNDDAGGNDHFTPKKMIISAAKGAAACIQSGTFFRGDSASGKSATLYGYAKCGGRKESGVHAESMKHGLE